ncbi:ribonuclease P protein component [Chondromyces crocatus]|uniref:Ribonuclease P protein component n=1 Tax=Chondromyces crocatus TaxID=52 RepID=A0A0K1EM63_CHOCO|nr:ribonuclease P protein component [Chondromyces crocatus]AKT41954.1 ribonuclease P [Chondromyces crocatus]
MGRLSRAQRIRKRPDFIRIQEGGIRVTSRHFLLLLAPSSDRNLPPRLGVVASRKVGGAVERNRSKRLVREVFRQSGAVFPAGIDVVVIVRPGAHLLSCAQMEAELQGVAPFIRRRAQEVLRRAHPSS